MSFVIGDILRLNEEWDRHAPWSRYGGMPWTVVGYPRIPHLVKVLRHGNKTPINMHESFFDKIGQLPNPTEAQLESQTSRETPMTTIEVPLSADDRVNAFHDHLDHCPQCEHNPMFLCPKGATLLRQSVEENPMLKHARGLGGPNG